jgi:hypothetical protein
MMDAPEQAERTSGIEGQQTRSRWAALAPASLVRTEHDRRLACILLAGLAFTLVILVINYKLFTDPTNEYSDFAANALQIEDAKHLRDLLGNYSRWGFHHPGPAFFYIFALGEALLHDWLRLAPDVMNAYIITIILLNSVFLFSVIGIFIQHCRSRLLIPVAVLLTIYVIYVINHTIPGSAFLSIWMPHVLLCCFLLFVTVCAAVAAGNVKQLPILAFTGLMLLHGHVALPIFVGPLVVLALGGALFSTGRHRDLKGFIRVNRLPITISALLVIVFAAPILLDVVLHTPSNVFHVRAYMSGHRGLQNSWPQALKYEATFFTFVADATIVQRQASAHLMASGASHPYVVIYWCFWCGLMAFTIGSFVYQRKPVSLFVKYLAVEILVIVLVFFYWGMRMAGPMFNFNGYFFYAVQLLVLLGITSYLLDGIERGVSWPIIMALSCAVPLLMFLGKPYFQSVDTGATDQILRVYKEETDRLIARFPARLEPVNVTVSSGEWLDWLGIISHLKRGGYRFCISDAMGRFHDPSTECHHVAGLQNLILARAPRKCELPCQTVEEDSQFVVQLAPYPWLTLPFQLDAEGVSSLNDNFYRDAGGMFATRRSSSRFLLAPVEQPKLAYVRIIGEGIPGRPVEVFLNGQQIGTIGTIETASQMGGQEIPQFVVDGRILRSGQENDLTFTVKRAAPVGPDWRDLGYFVKKIEFGLFKDKEP